jgi:16S rRNA (uracil1498-N3)-methyltransferase
VKTHRIFVPPEECDPERIVFSERSAHYLRKVLRLGSGDRVHAFNGNGEYVVELIVAGRGPMTGRIVERLPAETRPRFELILAFACVRPGPFQEILRHCTELGVSRFIPILSTFSNRKPTEKKERWQAVVQSAAQQSGWMGCPEVESPLTLTRLLQQETPECSRLILSPHARSVPILEVLEEERPDRALVLVGPEGGFDASEEASALEKGFRPASLGSGVLRTETAAVVAVGSVMLWEEAFLRRPSLSCAQVGSAVGEGDSLKAEGFVRNGDKAGSSG